MKKELWPIMNKIVKELKKDFGAEGLILCGSRAVGDYKSNSDWDMKVFVKNLEKIKSKFKIEKEKNIDIDCTFHKINTKFSWKEFEWKLRFSEVIFDNTKNKNIKKLLKEAQNYYGKGPKKWSKKFARGRMNKVQRYENKFQDLLKDKNWLELQQRLSWYFLENTYSWWYGVRSEWQPRPQEMFPDLKKRDLKFYNYLKKIVSNKTTQEGRVKLFNKLHKYFFSTKEFKKAVSSSK